jgi:uncharacterized Zn finger protein (UPF0148 family)
VKASSEKSRDLTRHQFAELLKWYLVIMDSGSNHYSLEYPRTVNEAGNTLADWLNSEESRPTREPVISLLAEIQNERRRIEKASSFLRETFRRRIPNYNCLKTVELPCQLVVDRLSVEWSEAGRRLYLDLIPNPPGVGGPWLDIVRLSQEGDITLLRRCPHCQKWFFAGRPNKIFCGVKCQLARFKTSNGWKENQQKIMAEAREKKRKEKLRKVEAAIQEWSAHKRRDDWKVWVSNHLTGDEVSRHWLTRAVNEGWLTPPTNMKAGEKPYGNL